MAAVPEIPRLPDGSPDTSFLAENNGPMMLAVVWPLFSVAGLFIGVRFYAKYWRGRKPWWDDYALVGAWFALLVNLSLATRLVQLGFGKHVFAVDPSNYASMYVIGTASGTFALTAIAWSKTSFALTLLRITTGWLRRLVWLIIVSMNIALALAALLHWVSCRPVHKLWHPSTEGSCGRMQVIFRVDIFANVSAYSAAMDFILALLPWYIIKGLRQMQRREKVGVIVAMSMGIFAGITAIVKGTYIPLLYKPDFTFDGPHLTIWGTAEIATTVVASSVPVLRIFFREISSPTERNNYNPDVTGVRSLHMASIISRRHSGSRSRKGHENRDDDSDEHTIADDSIMRTTEIAIDYHWRGDDDIGYEMGRVRQVND